MITITGTSGDDVTVVTDDGANVRLTNATAGAGCAPDGTTAVCARGSRTITANLLAGNDDFDNASSAEANANGGDGADLLVGRLRSADGGAAKDILRPRAMSGVVSLSGREDFDIYDVGADIGAADIITDTGANMVDYLSRPADAGGVTISANDAIANDGAAGEFDNVGTAATHVRGTVNADTITGTTGNADVLDGDLGADAIAGGDGDPTATFGAATLRGDILAFGLDAAMPYARPAASARTTGVTANLATGTTSDGDTLTLIDDLRGSPSDDVLTGSADRDVLEGAAGADDLRGGADNDVLACEAGLGGSLAQLQLVRGAHGGAGITASNACKLSADAGDGNDLVAGSVNGDTVRGGAGDDNLNGGDGDDLVIGGPGTDALQGGAGTDTVSFADDPSGVTISLASGSGQEVSGGFFENVTGSPFNDTLTGTDGPNVIDGGAGADTVSYADRTTNQRIDLAGGAQVAGGVAEDTLKALERANGGSGADTIVGTADQNVLVGNDGNDVIIPGLGADLVTGGNGRDQLSFDYLPAGSEPGITHTIGGAAAGNTEGDISLEIEDLTGSRRNDVLTGSAAANGLSGGDGDDRIVPGAGADTARGGAGTDTLDYSASPAAIHANLDQVGGLEVREFAATQTKDTLADQFENLTGSAFADVLRGTTQHGNVLTGGGGNDVLDGRSGADTLRGDSGNDRFGAVSGSVLETVAAAQVTVGNANPDGADTVLAGTGNDDVNVRDSALDTRVDCGAGTDVARQDLVDDDGDLDIDNCETVETTANDQEMTVVRVRRRGGALVLRLTCPKVNRFACKGRAGTASAADGAPRRAKRYRIRRGRATRVAIRGAGAFLVLVERDDQKRLRRYSRRL